MHKHRLKLCAICLISLLTAGAVHPGAQQYEPLAANVKTRMSKSVSDIAPPRLSYGDTAAIQNWISSMELRLARRIPDQAMRREILTSLHYEATRAGLEPELVLGLIEVESNFRKYAVSSASARGLMQVMPFWVDLIGSKEHNLFHLRTNLRYGCTILRHYLDIERGDLFRALGRYNGSLGRAEYPNLVLNAWKRNWTLAPTTLSIAQENAAGG
jgi:soluble lytic murein transglycosylase-like protein